MPTRNLRTVEHFKPLSAWNCWVFFSVEAREKSPSKNILKSTRGVHFTILPASPCAADFYETRRTRSAHRRNHVCQIFSRSVQGLRSFDTPKITISHWLAASPLQQCSTAVLHCDVVHVHDSLKKLDAWKYKYIYLYINSCCATMKCNTVILNY